MESFKRLKFRHLIVLFFKINRERVTNGLWNWFPEEKYPFYRISELKNGVSFIASQNKTLLAAEIACDAYDDMWLMSEERLKDKILTYISEIYGVHKSEVFGYDIFKTEFGYPIYLIEYDKIRKEIGFETTVENLYLAGRGGQFRYILTEESYDNGIECARRIHMSLYNEEDE